MEQLRRVVKEANDTRIAKRTILEKEISEMKQRLSSIEPDIIGELGIDLDNFECQKLLPSLYAESFKIEDYEKESSEFASILERIDNYRERLIEEAKKELGL